VLAQVLDWIYPPRCGLCARFDSGTLCGFCIAEFQPLASCLRSSDGPIEEAASLYQHEGRAAQAVRRLKYSRVTSLVDPLADLMRQGYEEMGLELYDLIVPIPIHWRRRAMRGFNQAEMLSSKLPRKKVIPRCLARIRQTRPQVGLNREERVKNLEGAFRASPDVKGRSVLLIDDVTTSGHTAEQCALALHAQGAASVGLFTFTAEL
jgi:ComF family protein